MTDSVPVSAATPLAVGTIRTDGGTQARAEVQQATVDEYVAAMAAGAIFPPVVVYHDGTDYWLSDGFHRLAAVKERGGATIAVEVRQGTRRDAVLHACSANATHGLRRTNADKRRAVETLLRDPDWQQWSNHEIGRRCTVDPKTVAAVREELETTGEIPSVLQRQTADGRTMDTSGIAAANAQRAATQPLPETAMPGQVHPPVSSSTPPLLQVMTPDRVSTMPPPLFSEATPVSPVPMVIVEIEDQPLSPAVSSTSTASVQKTPLPQVTTAVQPVATMPPVLPLTGQRNAADRAARERVAKVVYLRQIAALAEEAAAALQPGDERFDLPEYVAVLAARQYVQQGCQMQATMLALSVVEVEPEVA